MKKMFVRVTLVLAALVLLGACSKADGVRYDYNLAEYVEIGDVRKIEAPYADPTVCTEEEIDYAVHQVMLTYAEYTPKEDGSVIPGLYAGGDVVGSIEEKDGKKYGMGFDAALAYGYILGETVNAEI